MPRNAEKEDGERLMSTDPYTAVKGLCQKLEDEGVGPDRIVDALFCTGFNAGRILGGDDHMIAFLYRMAATFEASAKNQPPPPRLTQ
jgi:hypothetical protein